MTQDRATLNFINSFPDSVQKTSKEIQEKGAVKQIFGNEKAIQARINYKGHSYRVSLVQENNAWSSNSKNNDSDNAVAALATMYEIIERQGDIPEFPNEIDNKNLTEVIEDKLERNLKENELNFVKKLERRYQRYEVEGEIYDHDIVRLHSKWEVQSFNPLKLWQEQPNDIIEFWQYIAYAFYKKNISYLPFLNTITNLSATAEKIRAWELNEEKESWNQQINEVIEYKKEKEYKSISLQITATDSEFKFQWKEDKDFNDFNDEHLQLLQQFYKEGSLQMDKTSELIWVILQNHWRRSDAMVFRLDTLENCKFLNYLFNQKSIFSRIVNLDGKNFRIAQRKLLWDCRKGIIYESDDLGLEKEVSGYFLNLIYNTGEKCPHELRLLPGVKNFYLADDLLIKGPTYWQEKTLVSPENRIPTEIIESENGLQFLDKINCPIPDNIIDRVHNIELNLEFDAKINANVPNIDTEQFLMKIKAISKDKSREEIYIKNYWRVEKENNKNKEDDINKIKRNNIDSIFYTIENLNLNYDESVDNYRTRVTKNWPEKFIQWKKNLDPNVNLVLDEKLQSLFSEPVNANTKINVDEIDNDWYDISLKLNIENHELSQYEIKQLINARGDFVRISNGKWLRLQINCKDEQLNAIRSLGLEPYEVSTQKHKLHTLQIYNPHLEELFDKKIWKKIQDRMEEFNNYKNPPVPKNINTELRPYQVEGYNFLSYLSVNNFGGILADDMGLGKTIQSLSWLSWLKEKNKDKENSTFLVICPKSVVDVWVEECNKFAENISVTAIREKKDYNENLPIENDIIVINYAQLRTLQTELTKLTWTALILDEAQHIKNPDSKVAKAARSLKTKNRLVLTGTPIENKLLDIWSLMEFAMPGVLGNRKLFSKKYDKRKALNETIHLTNRLKPFLLRRSKNQVKIDLPAKSEEDILCEMSGTQLDLYEEYIERARNSLKNINSDKELNKNNFIVLQNLMKLRQVCCHPALIDKDYADEQSAKMDTLMQLINQLYDENHKVLVFSQFVSMLNIIKNRLDIENKKYRMLTGQTKNRGEIVRNFQKSTDPEVFLLSLKAGGSGLNLTASSYVILFDPWWNPAVENQAIDRTHRIGQNNPVMAYRLLIKNSVEEKIRILQKKKQVMADSVLTKDSFTKNITLDDLKFIFDNFKN